LVLEIEPELKRRLHARVAAEGRSLKDWFLEQAEKYLNHPLQEQLPLLPPRRRDEEAR
jgi:hypothetical protein